MVVAEATGYCTPLVALEKPAAVEAVAAERPAIAGREPAGIAETLAARFSDKYLQSQVSATTKNTSQYLTRIQIHIHDVELRTCCC